LALNSGYNYDNFREENFGNEILFDQTNSKLNAANWTEIKFNYSFTTENSNSFKESFGLNFKTNISYNSTHFQQESPTKMIYKDVETLLFFNDFRSESRYFVGNADNLFQKRGIGFGLDLGYSIYKKKSDVKDNHSYLYKLGVSVLDLGFLSFNKLSEVHVYEIIGPRELDIGKVKNYKDMSERVYGDRNKSFKKNSFMIYTPLAVSIQFDYNFWGSFYFNTTLVNRLNIADNSLIRPNLLSSSLRVEKKQYSLILNSTLYEYEKLMLGLSSRVGPVYFSIDNISNMLFKKDKLNHIEFMLGFKIYPFYKKTSKISEFSSNIILSIVLLMFVQTMIHILVNIGLFPTKGMGLPFISYGGTNLLLMFTYIGILIRIQIENKQTFSQAVLKNQK